MAKFMVYHFDMNKYCCSFGRWLKIVGNEHHVCKPPRFKEYKAVALVESVNVEDVFRITNHIESNWTNNREVFAVLGDRHRSTSVGDIAVNLDTNEAFLCASCGWDRVELDVNVLEGAEA